MAMLVITRGYTFFLSILGFRKETTLVECYCLLKFQSALGSVEK